MNEFTKPNPLQQEEKDVDVLIEQPAKVILYNDEEPFLRRGYRANH